ncbi:MAG: Vitamin K-dependent protein [Myxococcales bacterium]|nr:Vitamin K-dependent protein [Myxococcales bacterium]
MNRRNFAPLFGFAIATSFVACTGAPPTGSQVHSIINGTTDNGDPAVIVVAAQVPGSQMGSLCTGEIISPHVVLTAAHCVSPDTVGAGAKFIVFTGAVLAQGAPNSMFLPVMETHYDTMFDLNNPTAGHDVGVVILTSPTTITPIKYNRTPLPQTMVGQAARLVGYGLTNPADNSTAGTRREAPTKLASFDSILLNFQDMQHNICEGDSGGPAFMMVDGEEKIVGITSYGYQNCPVSMPGTDTRVDAYAKFIDPYVLQFDPPAKAGGDECTSDAECFPRSCQDSGGKKICVQTCDPATPPSGCPMGTMCMNVDNQNICAKPPTGSKGGCTLAAAEPVEGSAGFALFALAAIFGGLVLRRRARA